MNIITLPVASDRRYIRLARDLARRIGDGEFMPGDRLPPERELAQELSVSRTTVREALLALELMRYVEIRIGAGVFVLGSPSGGLTEGAGEEPNEAGPFEIVEMRRIIEGDAAHKAAMRMSDTEIERLDGVHTRMRGLVDDVPAFDRADREFHAIIARGAGNALMERTIGELWDMRHGALWLRWYDQTRNRENRLRSLEDHQRILNAIRRRLPEMAATAMRGHIDVLADRFFQLDLDADGEPRRGVS